MPDAPALDSLHAAVAAVPPGRWAVGVSGGADSVALLSLLRSRVDLHLHVAHLDHQTRGDASTADAAFVAELAAQWGVPWTVARRAELERRSTGLPANTSARFRVLRLMLFGEIVAAHGLDGVLLAHHADDQAETVLSRLLRGSGYSGLAGMAECSTVGGLVIRRSLLRVRRLTLRAYLSDLGQPWREDASNARDEYQRNRLRRVLAAHPALTGHLLALSGACRSFRDWVERAAPVLPDGFECTRLAALPPLLARQSAKTWLLSHGVPPADLARAPTAAVDRLIGMAADAASPGRGQFPGGVSVRRRRGVLSADGPRPSQG